MAKANETSPATTSEHTKGPWKAIDSKSGFMKVVTTARSVSDKNICSVYRRFDERAEVEAANVRLLAAAPELLEACDYALGFVRSWEEEHQVAEKTIVRRRLEAAIAKARGRTA